MPLVGAPPPAVPVGLISPSYRSPPSKGTFAQRQPTPNGGLNTSNEDAGRSPAKVTLPPIAEEQLTPKSRRAPQTPAPSSFKSSHSPESSPNASVLGKYPLLTVHHVYQVQEADRHLDIVSGYRPSTPPHGLQGGSPLYRNVPLPSGGTLSLTTPPDWMAPTKRKPPPTNSSKSYAR